LSFHTLQLYRRDEALLCFASSPSHTETYPPPEIDKLALRDKEITFWDRRYTTGTPKDEDTTKVLNRFPQDDKKLHSSTSNVWTDPSDNKRLGMRMGDDSSEDRDFDGGEEDGIEMAVRLER